MYAVERKFGSMDKDGFLVNEPPQSAAGKTVAKRIDICGPGQNQKQKGKNCDGSCRAAGSIGGVVVLI